MERAVLPPVRFQLDRREFLNQVTSAGCLMAAHGGLEFGDLESNMAVGQRGKRAARIRKLRLESAVPLEEMAEFYHRLLGLPIIDEQPDRLTVQAGRTELSFIRSRTDSKPFYHFAFNIPENKLLAARQWQKKRTPLLPIPPALRDREYPDDVVNFSHWNAHSIFFFDPSQNVVEYIARHDLDNAAEGDFHSEDILYASEIAFVVDDVGVAAQKLKEVAGVEQYRGASDQFAALGDERGLLLVMKRGRKISFDAAEKKLVSVFPTVATVEGRRPMHYAFPEFPYEVSVEA